MKALILFLLFYKVTTAQIQVIHHFEGEYKGSYPIGNLHLIGDVLYGCTFGDFILRDSGNIFKVDTDGFVYESIYAFKDTQGHRPECIIFENNYLYGNTKYGGKSGAGTIFKYNILQSSFSNIFNFDINKSNRIPDNKMILIDSFLYGVASGTQNLLDSGSIFKISLDGKKYIKLFDFKSPFEFGQNPLGPLVRNGNFLYGVTKNGGIYSGGNLYRIDLNGNNFKKIFNFDIDTFSIFRPLATPTLVDTWFYGVLESYSFNQRCIYKVSINGNSFKIIGLSNSNLFSPNLVYKNGHIYGTTTKGGLYNKGSLFKLRVKDEVFTYLNDFNGYNGAEPIGELLLDDQYIYGSASKGGIKNLGTLFKFEYCRNPFFKEQTFLLNIGDSIRVNGKYYKKPTFFIDSLYTFQGCDSIIITKILSKSQLESIDEKELIEFSQKANQLIFHPKITTPYAV
jgi:uncharacterized repeat protein (TIGR03803 family)